MISIVFGLLAMALGVLGMWVWWWEFLLVMKGLLPVSLVMSGFLAILMGFSGRIEKKQTRNVDR